MSDPVLSFTDDFQVTWADAADAAATWALDPMNWPSPLPPLSQALHRRIIAIAFDGTVAFVNGYAYMKDYSPPLPPPEVEARGPADVWLSDYLPRVREALASIRRPDYEALSAAELARLLPQSFDVVAKAFRYTIVLIFAFLRPTSALIEFCERKLGSEAGALAVRLLQGWENETAAFGRAQAEVAATARRHPAVAEALLAGRYDNLGSLTGGAEFLASFQGFLQVYGERAQSWGAAHLPTWAEDPSLALAVVAGHLRQPAGTAEARLAQAAADRAEAVREVESRLSGEDVAEFRRLLAAAAPHVAISEERAHWQLLLIGAVRRPALALGRKLVEKGVLATADDVFFLHASEVPAAAAGRGPGLGVIAERKAELGRQAKLTPPPYLGASPVPTEAPADLAAVMRYLRGLGPRPRPQPRLISGLGASRGVARGRARVILDLAEAARLQPGEILVCTTTSPPWTSLFAIAGGVVAESGGILCHTAICAREYALPCVVGARGAMAAIPDGAIITIDGATGAVTIEE